MDIDIDTLLAGKGTKIKELSFAPTEHYVQPFLDRMSKLTNDFRVNVVLPQQVTLTKDNEINKEDITYNRVWIQAVLPKEYAFANHQEVIGMVYGLDVRTPICKLYKGALNMACTNLCVFNPEYLNVQEINPATAINYKCITDLLEETDDMRVWLENLSQVTLPYEPDLIHERLGTWIQNSMHASYDNGYNKIKIATSSIIDAFKLLYENAKSPYYVTGGEETDMFNVYNAFTQTITNGLKKDSFNQVEKTILLKEILSLNGPSK